MTVLDLDEVTERLGLQTHDELLLALRYRYGTADKIITLASTELRSKDPDLLARCDREMAWFFDDVGNCFSDCWDGVRHGIENGEALAMKPTTGDLRDAWKGLPCVVLGAGPGVTPRWEAIASSRGHAILIATDVMLKPCLERGIIPDFVSVIERTPDVFEALQGQCKDGITLLAPPVVEKRVVDDFGNRVIWCWRGCGLEEWVDETLPRNNFGRSCGVQGLGVALLAGCSPIYLVGHDLCMDGNRTHAEGAQESVMGTADKLDRNEYHMRTPAKSISGRDVQTIHLWGMFKSDIEHLIREHKGCTVINTGDGLPILGTQEGEIPLGWWLMRKPTIAIPGVFRTKTGRNRRDVIPWMLEDIPIIEKRMLQVINQDNPKAEDLRLSSLVRKETAQVWTEIYHGTYAGALLRLHLRKANSVVMLKRVANAVVKTLPIIKGGLDAIKDS